MEEKRNFLIEAFPSDFVFVIVFSLLYVVSFFVTRGLAGMAKIDNIMSIRFILMFVTLYGLCAGVILGGFQKSVRLAVVGLVAGPTGSWINWVGVAMLCTWGVCYGLVLAAVKPVHRDALAWTVMDARPDLVDALGRFPGLIFGVGLAVGVVLIILYARLRFDSVYPTFSSFKAPLLAVLGVVLAVGVVLAFFSPRITRREFVTDSITNLPQRVNVGAVQGVNADIGLHLVKYGGEIPVPKKKVVVGQDNAGEDTEPVEPKKKPDIFFADYTISIKDGAVTILPGLVKTQVNMSVYLSTWMQIVTGKQSFSSAIETGQVTFTGSQDILANADSYFKQFDPPLPKAFELMGIIAAILLIGSFSVAPMLCVFDAFHYWQQEWPEEIGQKA